ncbi:MAG: RteC domain-containing protein [Bacteroidetes bacterium]|nr:RteC domain-containing protein [Bacteroidota bacterium]
MRVQPEQLYAEMMKAIAEKHTQPNKTDIVESCFWIASKYWEMLKKNIDKSFFEYEGKEINFFRNIKPKFTSQIQFYTMLAEVMLFVPEDIELKTIYWREEMKRYRRFCEKHKEFVDYYENKSVYLDSIYFVRVAPDWVPAQQPASYDADKHFCSSHDHLVRGLLANKMYYEYVREELGLVKNEI